MVFRVWKNGKTAYAARPWSEHSAVDASVLGSNIETDMESQIMISQHHSSLHACRCGLTETLLEPGVVPYPLDGKLATDHLLPSPVPVAPPPILKYQITICFNNKFLSEETCTD